jgi:copper(I)-binding protein
MRTLGTRRAVLAAGAAAVVAAVLAGCSAGQVAETSLKRPSDQGVNSDNSDGSVAVRNLSVVYNGTEGYAAGDNAPLELGLYNQTTQPITVTVSSARPTDGTDVADNGTATSVVLVDSNVSAQPAAPSATPEAPTPIGSSGTVVPEPSSSVLPGTVPSPSTGATPAAAAGQPAKITIAPNGYSSFLPGDTQVLQLTGLTKALRPGQAVYVTFTFDNGAQPLTLAAPAGTPATPVSRGPGSDQENKEQE